MDSRELTNRLINMYPNIRWSSSDVRDGLCGLEECHKALPGNFYQPLEIFRLVEEGRWNGCREVPTNDDWEVHELLKVLTSQCWEERYGKDGRRFPLGEPSVTEFLRKEVIQ
jgi:hypothetical protein